MRKAGLVWIIAGASALIAVGCATYPDSATTRGIAEKMVKEDFTAPSPGLLKRLEQDRAQQLCSKIGGAALTQEEAAEVVKLSRASIQYPASGKLVGDWKIGNKLAHIFGGGALPHPATVSEQYLLDLEREAFLSLLGERKTLERIQHTLKTGKGLRN